MHYQVCCIGHITQDKVITPAGTAFMPGGTAYYFSHAIANFCKNYLLATAVANSEIESVNELQKRGINVKRLPSKHTVYFENRYGENPDERWQRVLQEADAFEVADLQELEADIFHLGPLLANDISDEAIKMLAGKGRISLDVQGLLRKVEGQAVIPVDWKTKKEVLPYVHFLKANEEEMNVLTGSSDIERGTKRLADWGAKEIIITLGSKGSVICNQHSLSYIPAYEPGRLVDATGCGDTYMAGYLSKRVNGADVVSAGKFAAAMATRKLTVSGPFSGSEKDVTDILTGTPSS